MLKYFVGNNTIDPGNIKDLNRTVINGGSDDSPGVNINAQADLQPNGGSGTVGNVGLTPDGIPSGSINIRGNVWLDPKTGRYYYDKTGPGLPNSEAF